uniref:Putative secreted protein n=1 Tax=Anopheles darlingi TaxID=43151 RepID=A0A2M4D667_ANODA
MRVFGPKIVTFSCWLCRVCVCWGSHKCVALQPTARETTFAVATRWPRLRLPSPPSVGGVGMSNGSKRYWPVGCCCLPSGFHSILFTH